MVHNQLNPPFPRFDEKYRFATMKLNDEVKGRTGSQLMSTVWSVNFHRALKARPQIEVTSLPITDYNFCDACNRSGHPASFEIKLYGKPYSDETLESLSDDSDAQHGAEDSGDRDKDGHLVPSEDTRFFLGRSVGDCCCQVLVNRGLLFHQF
jgi:Domain of unknown function (DUF4211)